MKFKVIQTIRLRDTGEIIAPGAVYDDGDRATDYERDLLVAMNVLEPLPETNSTVPQQEGK